MINQHDKPLSGAHRDHQAINLGFWPIRRQNCCESDPQHATTMIRHFPIGIGMIEAKIIAGLNPDLVEFCSLLNWFLYVFVFSRNNI